MTTILVLLAALVGGNQQCQEAISLQQCDALLADGIPPAHDLGHIAVVKPPTQRNMEAKSQPTSMPAPEPAAQPDSMPVPVPVATATPTAAPKPEEPVAEPEVTAGWFVQVAAFGDRSAAQEGARRIGREDIQVVPTRRDGEEWFVLLLGSYGSYEDADSAGRDYAQDTGQDFWVRGASTLKTLDLKSE